MLLRWRVDDPKRGCRVRSGGVNAADDLAHTQDRGVSRIPFWLISMMPVLVERRSLRVARLYQNGTVGTAPPAPPAVKLHHDTHLPGAEFQSADAVCLAAWLATRCDVQDGLEDLPSDVFHAGAPIGDDAAVDVHIIGHALVHRRIGGQLDARHGLAAVD